VKLVTANAGDTRVVISRGGEAIQLTTDHVPDDREERERIEAQNPNPKLPLVRYVGKTWRVGGVLALSRAFGDAYMKSSLQFEGVAAGSDGYSSGFGVIAEPSVRVEVIGPDDNWVRLIEFDLCRGHDEAACMTCVHIELVMSVHGADRLGTRA
jgi:protein phosphatase 1K